MQRKSLALQQGNLAGSGAAESHTHGLLFCSSTYIRLFLFYILECFLLASPVVGTLENWAPSRGPNCVMKAIFIYVQACQYRLQVASRFEFQQVSQAVFGDCQVDAEVRVPVDGSFCYNL